MSTYPLLQVTDRPIEDLKPYHRTVRTHNRAQSRKLRALIRKHGLMIPVIADPNGVIIDGHLRWKCARDLKYRTVPTVVCRTNDPADIRAMRLALNRIGLDSGWDKQKLREEIKYLIEIDYDLDLTAFDAPEIDGILEIDAPSTGVVEDTDGVAPEGPAVTRLGDIIVCEPHRIVCGDALDPATLLKLLAGHTVRMVMTDPPYNVRIAGFVGGLGKIEHREFAQASGEMTDGEFVEFLVSFLKNVIAALVDGGLAYVWIDWRHIDALVNAGKRCALTLLNVCVWAKTTAGMGSLYRSQHEMCAVFKYGTAPHINNVELGKHGRSRSNLWTARGMASFGAGRDELLALHPTVKPVRLLADAILDVSKRGHAVLDAFLGSGSTLIACEEVGRRCFGIEIDPAYIDVSVRRWQKVTRKDALFADNGETFDERAKRLGVTARAEEPAAGDENTMGNGSALPAELSGHPDRGLGHE